MGNTFIINRIELKRVLTVFGISERNIDALLSELNKMHKHANAVIFAGMRQKLGMKSDDIANVLRRIGVDDITIANIFNTIDEERIKNTYGRIVELFME